MHYPDIGKPIKTLFRVKGKLIIDIPHNGLIGYPLEAFVKLYLEEGKQRTKITTLSQFKDKVEVSSPEAALDFVRLRTSETTWYFMQDFPKERAWAEVQPVGTRASSGYFGTTTQAVSGGFLVRRNIIHDSDKNPITDVFMIEEKVTPNGDYTILNARQISTKPLAKVFAGFFFPRFE
ncbi:MAG: hypothetical protein NTX57_16770 [Armatimonadetes bacterium]|nr:hypothetical protein [Armatimonadota bacterium]